MRVEIPPAVHALLQSGARSFVVPMERQPNPPSWACYGPSWNHDRTGFRWIGENPNGSTVFADEWPKPNIVPPFPPGTVLPVKEEWQLFGITESGTLSDYRYGTWVEYRDESTRHCEVPKDCHLVLSERFAAQEDDCPEWVPASEMPDWLARRYVVATDCCPVRVDGEWKWEVTVEPRQ